MPITRLALVLLLPLGLLACESESPAGGATQGAAEAPVLDEDAAMEALESDTPRPADSTSLGEALSTTPEEIGEGYAPANTESAEQQGVQPPPPAE